MDAIVFPPARATIETDPVVIPEAEKLFLTEMKCRPGGFIFYKGEWYCRDLRQPSSLFKPLPESFRKVPEKMVPKRYIAWVLILT